MNKKIQRKDGIVYSTNPEFNDSDPEQSSQETLAPDKQKLRLRLDAKQRAGKVVTILEGFSGNSGDLEDIGRKLKTFCGTGGSIKDGAVIIQGDQRDKLLIWLLKNNFKLSKKI